MIMRKAVTELLSEDAYLAWQRKLWHTFKPARDPNRFEVATARALWRAVTQATSGTVKDKFVSLSAATGSGKTYSAVALLAYLHSKGRRASMLLAQIHQIGGVYEALVKLMPREGVAVWSSVHRVDRTEVTRKGYHDRAPDDVRRHFVDPPRFPESECRNAPILLTTHASWIAELEGQRDLCIGTRGLIIADEEPQLERTFPFTSDSIHALRRLWAIEGVAPRHGFDNPIADTLERIRLRAAQVEQDEAPFSRLRGVELVDAEEMELLTDLRHPDVAARLDANAKGWAQDYDRHWDTVVALKAAGQGRVFYSCWTRQFFAYVTAFPPVPGLVVLDATADLSAAAISDTIHLVEDVPAPSYPSLRINLVYPPNELQGRLLPTDLYKNRIGCEKVYAYVMVFIRKHTGEDSHVLVYAKKDFLDKLSDDELRPTDPEGRVIYFTHFGTGRGFNTWKDCDVYVRLSDAWPNREAMVAKLGVLLNKAFSEEDWKRFSTSRIAHPELDTLCKLHLLAYARQDLARTRVRQLDGKGRPKRAVDAFLIDPAHIVRDSLQKLWPGSPEPTTIGKPKAKSKALNGNSGSARLVKLLRNPNGHWELTPTLICEQTGVRRKDLAETMRLPAVKDALGQWRKVPVTGKRGRSWKLEYSGDSAKV